MLTVTYKIIEHGLQHKNPQTFTKTFQTVDEQLAWEQQQAEHPFLSLELVASEENK